MSKHLETSLDIAATPERVWSELTRFSRFPEWSRFILSISGDLHEGSRLEVRIDDGSGPTTFKPILLVQDACRELRWRGKLGTRVVFSGEHYFKLMPMPDGRTRLVHGEIFGGLLVSLLWKRLDTRTRKAFGDFNEALRVRSEAQPA